MIELNASGIEKIELEQAKRRDALQLLTRAAFDINNSDQQKSLKKYIDDFELLTHQMNIIKAMSACCQTLGVNLFLYNTLPTNYFLMFVSIGAMGYLLHNSSQEDFVSRLNEMKKLYNWCLKGNTDQYSPAIDNSEKLANPEIQRFVKLMAPRCSREFTMVWPQTVVKPEGWSKVFNTARTAFNTTFWPAPAPTEIQNNVKELKRNVETGGFSGGILSDLIQALAYFGSIERFKGMLKAKLPNALDYLVPEPLANVAKVAYAKMA